MKKGLLLLILIVCHLGVVAQAENNYRKAKKDEFCKTLNAIVDFVRTYNNEIPQNDILLGLAKEKSLYKVREPNLIIYTSKANLLYEERGEFLSFTTLLRERHWYFYSSLGSFEKNDRTFVRRREGTIVEMLRNCLGASEWSFSRLGDCQRS